MLQNGKKCTNVCGKGRRALCPHSIPVCVCVCGGGGVINTPSTLKSWQVCQSEQQTIAIFQFRIRECIRFVVVAFRSEEEVLWRRGPSLTYFCAALDPPLGGSSRKA